MHDHRPNPDILLARVQEEEAHRTLVLDTAGPDAQACATRRATLKVPVRALAQGFWHKEG